MVGLKARNLTFACVAGFTLHPKAVTALMIVRGGVVGVVASRAMYAAECTVLEMGR